MRIDDYISTVGLVKRRTIAKKLADSDMIMVNGKNIKASYQIKLNDIISIKGTKGISAEVLDIPAGSVSKQDRENYIRVVS